MQPQGTDPQVPSFPGQFDFMFKDRPKPPGRIRLLFSGIPKPAKIVLAALSSLLLLVILYTIFLGGKTTNTDQLTSVMATAREISRVSALAQQQAQAIDTKDLATTTGAVLSSQEQELRSYLKTSKVKIDNKKLAAKLDKNTDKQLTTALQNNNYDQTYFNYLKTNLANYLNTLNVANKDASSKVQTILKADYNSVQTLLGAPQLK